MICKSKSLPSAREGLQNYTHNLILINGKKVKGGKGYLSSGHDEGRLEGELISQEDVEVEFVYGAVQILTIYC